MLSGKRQKIAIALVFLLALSAVLLCVMHSHRKLPTYPAKMSADFVLEVSETESFGVKLNINQATIEELDALPGVGPVLAERIVLYRITHGQFYDIGELREVEGIGDQLLQDLLKYLCT